MDTLKAKGVIFEELKSKLTTAAYRKNSTLRSKNTRRINSDIARISKILETPNKQEKAYKQKIEDLKTLKALIEEEASKGDNNATLRSVKEPEPRPATRTATRTAKSMLQPAAEPAPQPAPQPMRFSYPTKKQDNPPTIILGHAKDLCYPNGKLVELVVPENCTYITFTECGLVQFDEQRIITTFVDPKNRKYILDPVKYEKELNLLFNNPIHIHRAGTTYINTQYYPTGYDDNGNMFTMSGVVPLEEDTRYVPYYRNFGFGTEEEKEPTDLSRYFQYSIFPTAKDVKEQYSEIVAQRKDSEENILKKFYKSMPSITQEWLFSLRPGIYYNSLCRSTHPFCHAAMRERRRYSLANAKRVISEIDLDEHLKFFKKIVYKCVEKNSCEEVEELIEELPQLSFLGLSNLKREIEHHKDKNHPLLLKMIEHITLLIKDLESTDPLLRKCKLKLDYLFASWRDNLYPTTEIIKPIIELIDFSPTREKKAKIIRLLNIEIDRGIFVLEKLRNSLKMHEGGKRKTRKN